MTQVPPPLNDVCPGDVYQIDPGFEGNKAFSGCFFVVTEPRETFCQGYVQGLGADRYSTGGQAHICIQWEYLQKVGEAVWICG